MIVIFSTSFSYIWGSENSSFGKGYHVDKPCKYLSITRSAYYQYLKHPKSNNELHNKTLYVAIQKIHTEHPNMRYRRIRNELDEHKGIHVNDKRVLHICKKCNIESNIKWLKMRHKSNSYWKNYLRRNFHTDKSNEKWHR